ncbi:MAG: prepilin peptidase [Nitrospirae bacterium]|nr:prepilin peptidase [Nitrospirota bacterium]
MIMYIIFFIYGLLVGSFLNVCIYRIPMGLSIVRPGSLCPSCGNPVKFYDNIPVLGYIFLGGKCRACKAGISSRYPLVEFLNAVLYIILVSRFGTGSVPALIVYCALLSALVVITFIDIDYQIIPDVISLSGIPLGLLFGATLLPDPFLRTELLGFKTSFIGFLAGGAGFYMIAVLGKLAFRKDAMGGGDIKLMGMIGGFLGWKGVILTTFLGSLFGAVIGIALIVWKGREWGAQIPFGPYLALGAVASLFWGQEILAWYGVF